MQLSPLQYDCLHKMGITIFDKKTSSIVDYFVAVEYPSSTLLPDEELLLNKILLALNWPADKIQRCYHPKMIEKLKQFTLKRAVLFSDSLNHMDLREFSLPSTVVLLPSLKALQNSVEAKRLAWKAMQPLVIG